ncbi:MAG: type II toxin-antitoxin system RelE/ParE family toxin [Burkholderiales bacterium]|jgi:plasmid stabilization system protein ParE|nr:type II toxin-antitoxin system RelE/ParE family toxin [Burkholderiales bacterium]
MKLKWTDKALSDLVCLHEFLAATNSVAAAQAVQTLAKAPTLLHTQPRIGEQLFHFESREVRRILAAWYEIRYEIQSDTVYVLRPWHTKEDR